jgi:hypothetical protein
MRKLYKRRNDGVLLYNEAWLNGAEVIEHFGQAGTRGDTRTHKADARLNDDENVARVLTAAIKDGFTELDADDHRVLLVEYSVVGWGSTADLEKRHELENRLNETLGWTGLGHVDGGSIGSGTMEVCCIVVDLEVARKVIETDLRNTKFANYTRIYDESTDE